MTSDLPRHADILIAGGGTAGCAIAGLLAEQTCASIVVLEAGPDYGPLELCRWPNDLTDPRSFLWTHEWGYRDSGDDGRTIALPRARVLAGCSAHNGCEAVWGNADDYDAWAAQGLSGWSAAELQPILEQIDHRMRVCLPGDELSPFSTAFVEAAARLGYRFADDLGSLHGTVGIAPLRRNLAHGVRWNSAFAYLDPIRDRVTITDNALIDRLEFAGDRATGVRFRRGTDEAVISADLIVIAAGCYGSPAILLRSGIGRPEELARHAIPVRLPNSAVGENLHDHPQIEVIFCGTPLLARQMATWASRSEHAFPGQAVLKARSAHATTSFDIHVWANGGMPLSSADGWTGGVPFTGDPATWNWEFGVACLTPRSRGHVRLADADPASAPLIDHRFLSDHDGHDIGVLCEGIRLVRELAVGELVGGLLGEELPPTAACNDRASLLAPVRSHCVHYWHPVGTCAMGPVVDAHGKLNGLENVYVGDASIMPTIPRANTNMPTIAVAHRVAAWIASTTRIAHELTHS